MSRLRVAINRHFGQDSLKWFDRSYVTDWMVVGAIWLISGLISASPVFQRDFSLSDPSIGQPHKKNQVGSIENQLSALFVPLSVITVTGGIQKSLVAIHHGAIALCASRGMARLVTEGLKHSIGRLRPDFLARCKWDDSLKYCSGKMQDILDGRKSFPSGHSSAAFSGMFFLSLWIAGQTAAWCFNFPQSPQTLRSGRMLPFFLTLIPMSWATHVAITRIQDYRHHKEDVVVGSLIGIITATISYLMFWPNPLAAATFYDHGHGQPRLLYTESEPMTARARFELTRLQEDELDV